MAFTRLIWSFRTHPRTAGFGGLDRNYDKAFQFGFYGSIGWSNILHAEIQDLLVGLKLWWKARKFICYYDSLHVVQLGSMNTHHFHHYANMLEIYQSLHEERLEFFSPSDFSRGQCLSRYSSEIGS